MSFIKTTVGERGDSTHNVNDIIPVTYGTVLVIVLRKILNPIQALKPKSQLLNIRKMLKKPQYR